MSEQTPTGGGSTRPAREAEHRERAGEIGGAVPESTLAATNGPLVFSPGLESEPFPPPRSNAKTRLTWVRALAQQQNVPWAVVQLADLVQDLIEWRDRHEPDAWDGSDWT